MKTLLSSVTLGTALLLTMSAQAQPAYKYNDRYPSQSYFPSSGTQGQPLIYHENDLGQRSGGGVAPKQPQQPNKKDEIWFGGPPAHVGDGVVVHSPPPGHTLKGRPPTDEALRNAKPMGKYIDTPPDNIKPLPRGGNQPPPSAPQYYTPPGVINGDPGAPPQAMPGYPGVSEGSVTSNSDQRKHLISDQQARTAKPMGQFVIPPRGGDPILPPGSDPRRELPSAVALPPGTLRPMTARPVGSQ